MSSTLTSAPLGTDSLPGRRPFIKQSNGFRRTRKCGDEYVWQSHTTCLNLTPAILSRWLGGLGTAAPTQLEKRTRRHLRAARVVRRANLIKPVPRQQWIDRAHDFFADHDVLITPMFATLPPAARRWSARGWTPNALTAIRLTPFLGPWDLAGFPTMSVPAARYPSGLPIGVQLVAPPGGESRLLALAAQLESLNPWPRTAPQPPSGECIVS
jgi:amidase